VIAALAFALVAALAAAPSPSPSAAPSPSPSAAAGPPASAAPGRTEVVDLGGARGYVRHDPAAPLAGIELFVRAGLDRQTTAQDGLAALVAETILRSPVEGPRGASIPLIDAVDARGGSLSYAVSAQTVRFYLEGTPDGVAAAAPLVARVLASPSYEAATLTAARAALGERISDDEDDPRLVGRSLLRASYYRGPAGRSELGNRTAIAGFGAADVKAFHDRWYLRGGAAVAEVGDTGPASDGASRALIAALADGTAPEEKLQTRPYGAQPKRIVTQRDVGAPYVVFGFAAPPLGDRDFAAALVVRSLMISVLQRPTATSVPAELRSGGALYGYDVSPAQLVLWINGARLDPAIGLTAVDTVLKTAASKPLAAAVLARMKETARGEWALEAVSLDQRAGAIGNAVSLGLDADANDGVGAAIARVTAADVRRVTKKYFQGFDVALIVPRSSGS
jgi:zinc protease